MNISPEQNVSGELKGDREIVISRIFDAPRQLVWKAWTDPNHISSWWGPRGFDAPPCEVDLRPGGTFLINLNGPDGNIYPCKGTFREVVEPERIVYDGPPNEPAGCGAGIPPDATVTVIFADIGKQTKLTIHTLLASEDHRIAARNEGFIEGWQQSLNRLAEEIEKGAIKQND
ncbi:SRPBCC domain-containing protein [Leptolyngbya sp. 7M]|uniref:SRPBCC family protein n=1 Tax=Leptolyngbya sp. 7M TaxID=2812896 RepID=UPI001B8D3628|nr:SRPBCC domain-containing protein [Leptolyngbya sp. 7M]QYO66529.1 SRPBCC domain-containing protein [Leptolyngbya sp. 7M]